MTPAESGRGRTGAGRTLLAFALVALGLVVAVLVGQPVWQAKRIEQTLLDRHGEAASFIPAPDGSIAPERMEAFVRVREQVHAFCPDFQKRIADLLRLEELEQDETIPKAEVAREGVRGLKRLAGFAPVFIRFIETRNRALLAEEMGLGEYFYIYVLAYSERLRQTRDTPYGEVEQAFVGQRARAELTRMLEHQLAALASGDVAPPDAAFVSELREQITRLSSADQDLPWEGELPPAIGTSIAPYAETLAPLYCPGIAKIELMQKNKGLNIRN